MTQSPSQTADHYLRPIAEKHNDVDPPEKGDTFYIPTRMLHSLALPRTPAPHSSEGTKPLPTPSLRPSVGPNIHQDATHCM